jgi:hypothetical protein
MTANPVRPFPVSGVKSHCATAEVEERRIDAIVTPVLEGESRSVKTVFSFEVRRPRLRRRLDSK